MRILDLFAGLGGERRRLALEFRGHEYITLDIEPKYHCNITADIMDIDELGEYDFIWASPPCEAFSVASIGHHWRLENGIHYPKTEFAVYSMGLVKHTVDLINNAEKKAWIIENPRGILRMMPFMKNLPRQTVTYCKYGDTRMKPTDLWGVVPGWIPRPACKNGDPCHDRAPRGTRQGTQGIKNSDERAVVPLQLWTEIVDSLDGLRTENNIWIDR